MWLLISFPPCVLIVSLLDVEGYLFHALWWCKSMHMPQLHFTLVYYPSTSSNVTISIQESLIISNIFYITQSLLFDIWPLFKEVLYSTWGYSIWGWIEMEMNLHSWGDLSWGKRNDQFERGLWICSDWYLLKIKTHNGTSVNILKL